MNRHFRCDSIPTPLGEPIRPAAPSPTSVPYKRADGTRVPGVIKMPDGKLATVLDERLIGDIHSEWIKVRDRLLDLVAKLDSVSRTSSQAEIGLFHLDVLGTINELREQQRSWDENGNCQI